MIEFVKRIGGDYFIKSYQKLWRSNGLSVLFVKGLGEKYFRGIPVKTKELKDLIIAIRTDIKGIDNRLNTLETRFTSLEIGQTKIEEKLEGLETRFTSLEIRQARIEGKLEAVETASRKIPDLAERVGELKNWKQIGLTLSGALLGGLIIYLAKNSNP